MASEKTVWTRQIRSGLLGKAIGGTLGAPFEGSERVRDLTFYDPVPEGMVPNDDLDLQIMYAVELDKMATPRIDREVLGRIFQEHNRFCFDEYNVALRNLRMGIRPPHSGVYDNGFPNGLGAAIRSELWAFLAPGDPALAAGFAEEDACIDHAGEGIYAARFLAALESAAFVTADIRKIILSGLEQIPSGSRLAAAIGRALEISDPAGDWKEYRRRLLEEFGCDNFTDVVMNLPLIVMALLVGNGDFSRSVCIAAGCGKDADCLAATVGAVLGILDPDCIPEKWLAPIGDDCVISPPVIGIEPPEDCEKLTAMIEGIRSRLAPWQPGGEPGFVPRPVSARCGTFSLWLADDDRRFFPELPEKTVLRSFPGTHGSIPAETVEKDSLYMMEFAFELKEDKEVLVMFNTPENVRIWLDGVFLFGREGGRLAPSFHRAPINQRAAVALKAGTHRLLAGIAPSSGKEELEWYMGVADAQSRLYLEEEIFSWIIP